MAADSVSTAGSEELPSSPDAIPTYSSSQLWWQRFFGRIALFPLSAIILAIIHWHYRFRIPNLSQIRKQFREISQRGRPLVICANHLTMVDSVIILWALATIPRYFWNYRLFSWNIPAVENFAHRPVWKQITYLTKCIPIDRQGDKEHLNAIFRQVSALLNGGEVCTVFPEGTRSRTGRINVEAAGYGIGKILRDVPGCEVLCIYMRGEGQTTYSEAPRKGESFYFKMELITPHSRAQGLRGVRDCSLQIMNKLKSMEDEYFGHNKAD